MPTTKSNKEVDVGDIASGEVQDYGSTDGGSTWVPKKVDSDGHTQVDVLTPGGFSIPNYDYIALTYVAAGNGAGEVETVVYKSGGAGGTTVATITLTYNASDEIATATKT